MVKKDTLMIELEAPTRMVNSLLATLPPSRRDSAKVGDFLNKSDHELLRLDNFGHKSLAHWQELTRHLRKYSDETVQAMDDVDSEYRALRKMRVTLNTISGLHVQLARLYREIGDIVLPNDPKKGK